ncbi:hypothetical protein GBA65_06900 [Rubrobacter marinus]|uniref:Uncharacterized protein n=1 Tax=Rubrobacter marinus TaxID=2653852 RepID=A0A6G8PVT5_9ACTN|nr:hypothetical protein [Rubrobacter marinus]QIN78285.1 hypothetical protein GBA65_06900 [Rubrobacter marinus]
MQRVSKWGRARGKGAPGRRFSKRSVAVQGVVWGLVVLVVAAVAVPLLINNRYTAWDGAAKGRLLRAAAAMDECAQLSRGSYAGCDAYTMKGLERGVRWRDPTAEDGYFAERKRDKVGLVFVSERGEESFRVETTSRTGRLFAYDYQGGEVARTRTGNAEGPVPW